MSAALFASDEALQTPAHPELDEGPVQENPLTSERAPNQPFDKLRVSGSVNTAGKSKGSKACCYHPLRGRYRQSLPLLRGARGSCRRLCRQWRWGRGRLPLARMPLLARGPVQLQQLEPDRPAQALERPQLAGLPPRAVSGRCAHAAEPADAAWLSLWAWLWQWVPKHRREQPSAWRRAKARQAQQR